jgi:hypothetical protein
MGHAGAQWLRHCAIRGKVAGSRRDAANTFFSINLILPAALGPEVYSASNRNEYQRQKNTVRWNEWQGEHKYTDKTCHTAVLSTTNPT